MDSSPIPPQDGERRGARPAWLAAGAIALLVLALLAFGLAGRPPAPPAAGSPVPAFQLVAVGGAPMDLSAQRGRVVVLNFFASWCEPCREEAADLEQTWRSYAGQPVQFFGIAYKDASSKATAFLSEFGVTYPFVAETGNRTARAYGVTGVPETFVIDQAGNLVSHFVGPVTQAELSQEIDHLLAP